MYLQLKLGDKGFVFSVEALLSLIACGVLIASLSLMKPVDLSNAVLYREGSDILDVAVNKEMECDEVYMRTLINKVDPTLKAEIKCPGKSFDVNSGDPDHYVVITRTRVEKGPVYKEVTLTIGK